MDSNTDSMMQSADGPAGEPAGLARLAAAVQELASQDLSTLPDGVAAERVLALRMLLERLEGQWLKELATVDRRGAAGAELGTQDPSTAGWLRARACMSAGAANQRVRLARALHHGPLVGTAAALAAGQVSVGHAAVLADGTHDLTPHTIVAAEPVLLEAARRLDPGRLRRVVPTCGWSPTPTRRSGKPSGGSNGAGCTWPAPGRACWPSRGCWTPKRARPYWRRWTR